MTDPVEYPQLNDPKVSDLINKMAKDISNQWTIVEGYRATITEAFKELADETKVPIRMLRKLARAYHMQTFETEVQEADDFEVMYEKVFGSSED